MLHGGGQRGRAALAIAAPVGEQGRRKGSVADRADVGPAVAEARHGERVAQQLVQAVERTDDAVEERY